MWTLSSRAAILSTGRKRKGCGIRLSPEGRCLVVPLPEVHHFFPRSFSGLGPGSTRSRTRPHIDKCSKYQPSYVAMLASIAVPASATSITSVTTSDAQLNSSPPRTDGRSSKATTSKLMSNACVMLRNMHRPCGANTTSAGGRSWRWRAGPPSSDLGKPTNEHYALSGRPSTPIAAYLNLLAAELQALRRKLGGCPSALVWTGTRRDSNVVS